jgi:tetratricopeptide (TPR) repeat protein
MEATSSASPEVAMRITALVAIALGAGVLAAQDHVHPAGDPAKVGRVTFATSCSPAVQPRFEQAVAMLHSFWFEAAEREFRSVATADPGCAMAYWGHAMTLLGNPMTRIAASQDRLAQGLALAQRAVDAAASASHREQMYAAAVMAYYRDFAQRDHMSRMRTHEEAFDALRRAHPEDPEATIFYARTLVANAPPTDMTFSNQLRAAELMQPLFDARPTHPGLAHYLIHAYDAPPLANKGAAAARAYAGIAPDAPHALHMPSHIFTRLGHWDESIETNARSARAEPDSNAAVHPMDYMVYAYLQQGRARDARSVVDRAVQNPDRFYGGALGYNFAAMPARYALERGAWAEAAGLRIPTGGAPYVRAITHFARGIGAARAGNAAQARTELDSLASLKAQSDRANDSYWSTVIEAQRLAVSAWVTLASGNRDAALALARNAADLEETVEKHPVTPGPILPARELLGDMLLETGRSPDAIKEYEKTLTREPRRLRTLYGAAVAAEKAGNAAAARKHYSELAQLLSKADPGRPELLAARRYLSGN